MFDDRFQKITMTHFTLILIIIIGIGAPTPAVAGMPAITLSDVAAMRVQDISFFLLLLLIGGGGIQWMWNYLRHDFEKLPYLTYKRALSLSITLALGLTLALSMIAGARELLTPDAWRKQGYTYKSEEDFVRIRALEMLRAALFDYAGRHDGRFPADQTEAEISSVFWQPPNSPQRYAYQGGLSIYSGNMIIAHEPDSFGDTRYALRANGLIEKLPASSIFLIKSSAENDGNKK